MPLRNIFFIALSIIVSLACYSVAAKNRHATLFAEALDLVENEALQQVPREQLFDSAMKGMLSELDEHSTFISGERYKAFNDDMRQKFGGVGMYVDNDTSNEKLIVLAPIPGTPAFEAGVQIGDEILEIDGQSTQGVTRADAIKRMRGPVGKAVEIVMGRGGKRIKMSLKRASINVPSVHGDWRNPDGSWNYVLKEDSDIGYIRLLQFGDHSTEEIRAAIEKVNGRVDGLILDLRNNTGGLLTSATDICDMFLEGNLEIVSTKARRSELNQQFKSSTGTVLNPSTPVVVLVNRNSASASEILAACLQDHDRAVIIGEQSYGKGTVQNIIPMQRNRSVLKLTTASYWRPSGIQIDRNDEKTKESGVWGVQPNEGYAIELSEADVFENIRRRSVRDLMGLRRDGTPVPETQLTMPLDREETQSPQPDSGDDQSDKGEDKPQPESDPDSESKDGSATNSEADAGDAAKEKEGNADPHVDKPMQRAIEHFNTLLRKAIAA